MPTLSPRRSDDSSPRADLATKGHRQTEALHQKGSLNAEAWPSKMRPNQLPRQSIPSTRAAQAVDVNGNIFIRHSTSTSLLFLLKPRTHLISTASLNLLLKL